MADILLRLGIDAPPSAVYRALTTLDGLRAFWTPTAQMPTASVGELAVFTFNSGAVVFRMRIEALDEAAAVVWRCVGNEDAWTGTAVTFGLEDLGGRTRVDFAHRGWLSADGLYARCAHDWSQVLAQLKLHVETGTVAPYFPDAARS